MRNIWITVFMSLVLIMAGAVMAQGQRHGGGGHGLWPDSLETVEVTGTVIVDSSYFHPMFYLDLDGDTNADYLLSFGPWWYQPESGATRPEAGDNVTIVGEVRDHMTPPVLMVFEINGEVWREATSYGRHGWSGGHVWEEQGDTLTVTGVVLVDTSYFYNHYFLDTDNDSIPEYKLGFGPHWYEPESGAVRPDDGETVTIFGRTHEMMGIDMLSVYIINGLEWRSPDQPAPWAGTWMRMGHSDSVRAYCVNDSSNWVGFPPGHMGGGMGMMWPDSMFVQFWQIHPDSLPGRHNGQHFMGFYLDMHDPQGRNMMDGRFGGRHGRMGFQKEHEFRFHYYDEDIEHMGGSESGLIVKYWDDDNQQWQEVSDVTINTSDNTVLFKSNEVGNYYAIAEPNLTTDVAGDLGSTVPTEFVLQQNYPNPFNPSTTIQYEVPLQSKVQVSVYNLLGQKIAVIVNDIKSAGVYTIQWNGLNDSGQKVSSGIYLVRLEAGEQVKIRRMTLIK